MDVKSIEVVGGVVGEDAGRNVTINLNNKVYHASYDGGHVYACATSGEYNNVIVHLKINLNKPSVIRKILNKIFKHKVYY